MNRAIGAPVSDPVRFKPVVANAPDRRSEPVAKDKFNLAAFDAVTTTMSRLAVQLSPNFSSGILEWQVR